MKCLQTKTDTETPRSRIQFLDIMKGIGILLVIIGHFYAPSILSYIIWSFHLPMFVIISGLFLKPYIDKDRIKKLASNYLKPYFFTWLCIVLFESLKQIFKGLPLCDIFQQRLISGFWALGSNSTINRPEFVVKEGVIWFLMALFVGSIYLSIILNFFKSKISQINTILVLWGLSIFLQENYCLPLQLSTAVPFVLWLYIGYLIKNSSTILTKAPKCSYIYPLIWLITFTIAFLTGNKFSITVCKLPLCGVEILGAYSGFITFLLISKHIESTMLGNLFNLLGKNSLYILCAHGFDIECLGFINTFIEFKGAGAIIMVIRLIVDLLLAFLIKHLSIKISKLYNHNQPC